MALHCPHCFRAIARGLDKHVAFCKLEKTDTTLADLTVVVKHLLGRVDAQDKLIAALKRPKRAASLPPGAAMPVLAEPDLKLFLAEGVPALLAAHAWPVAVVDRTFFIFADEWTEATDPQVRAVVSSVLQQLMSLLEAYVDRKGWRTHDPNGRYPEFAAKLYAVDPAQLQKALLKAVTV